MSTTSTPRIQFKRGDDFKLDMTVTDKNNTTAIAAAALVVIEQAAYDVLLAASPQVPADIAAQLIVLDAAIAAYDLAIIVDITGWAITSSTKWRGKLVDNFTITIINALIGNFTITKSAANTLLWSPRVLDMDVQFDRPEGKVSSETLQIDVEKDITDG